MGYNRHFFSLKHKAVLEMNGRYTGNELYSAEEYGPNICPLASVITEARVAALEQDPQDIFGDKLWWLPALRSWFDRYKDGPIYMSSDMDWDDPQPWYISQPLPFGWHPDWEVASLYDDPKFGKDQYGITWLQRRAPV